MISSIETALGPLTRDGDAWYGSLRWQDRTLSLRLRPAAGASLDLLVELVRSSLQQLDGSAEKARRYAVGLYPDLSPSELVLEGVEATVPDREWLRKHHLPSERMLTLILAMPEDRNVLDVVFCHAEPVALEYH
jgi:hypothetical protein